MLRQCLVHHGFTSVVTGHIHDFKTGATDFPKFLAEHDPAAIIYDISIPLRQELDAFAAAARLGVDARPQGGVDDDQQEAARGTGRGDRRVRDRGKAVRSRTDRQRGKGRDRPAVACGDWTAAGIIKVSCRDGRLIGTSFNGRTPRSGRGYWGSNPYVPANLFRKAHASVPSKNARSERNFTGHGRSRGDRLSRAP
jgi:hypothetical protein